MPSNTVTEFRDANPYGRSKQKSTKHPHANKSNHHKKNGLGNTTNDKKIRRCLQCWSHLCNKMDKMRQVQATLNDAILTCSQSEY